MATAITPELELVHVPLTKVKPDPNNPRQHVDVDDEFVQSIKEQGILQPITVVPAEKDGEFRIAFGERRWTGAKAAGLKQVPVIVRRDLDPVTVYQQQVVENLHRAALTPLEEAAAYVRLTTELKVPQRDLVGKVGRSQGYISKLMQLVTKLPAEGQALVDSGRINVTDAVELARLADEPKRFKAVLDAYTGTATGYYSGPETLRRELQAAKDEQARKKIVAKLEEDGITVLSNTLPWQNRIGGAIDLVIGDHVKEPCHAAYVSTHGSGEISYYCTEPSRHGPDGESKLKLPERGPVGNGLSPEERARLEKQHKAEEAQRAAFVEVSRARRTWLATLLGSGFQTDAAVTFLTQLVVRLSTWDEAMYENTPEPSIARALLGIEEDPDDEAVERIDGEYLTNAEAAFLALADDPTTALRAAVAGGCSVAEKELSNVHRGVNPDTWADPIVRAYVTFLTAHGWKPSKAEEDVIGRADQVLAARAAALAEAAAAGPEAIAAAYDEFVDASARQAERNTKGNRDKVDVAAHALADAIAYAHPDPLAAAEQLTNDLAALTEGDDIGDVADAVLAVVEFGDCGTELPPPLRVKWTAGEFEVANEGEFTIRHLIDAYTRRAEAIAGEAV